MSAEPMNVTDATLDSVLNTDKPVFILFTNGDGLRGDFKVAYNKLASENRGMIIARIDPQRNPDAAARFGAGEKPLLIGVLCGEVVVHRPRPWGSDLPLALEAMQTKVKEMTPPVPSAPAAPENRKSSTNQSGAPAAAAPVNKAAAVPTAAAVPAAAPAATVVVSTPVAVTDATFESEVLNSDLPVMVDFWAEWCGPCRMVAPILDKLAAEFAGQIRIAKVDVDANPGLSQAFQIRSIPNLMIVKQRTIIFNQPGALPEAVLRDLIQQAIAIEIPPRDAQPAGGAESSS